MDSKLNIPISSFIISIAKVKHQSICWKFESHENEYIIFRHWWIKTNRFCGFLILHYIQMCLQTILILERNKVVGFVKKLTRTEHHKTRSNGNQTVEIISIFPLILNKRNYFHVLFQFDSIFVEWTAQKNQQEKN